MSTNNHNYNRCLISKQIIIFFTFLFHIIFSLGIPIIKMGIHMLMKQKGISYLTLQNFASFLSYGPTIILILLILIALLLFISIKIITISHYSFCMIHKKNTHLLTILSDIFMKGPAFQLGTNISLLLYSILLYLFTNIPLLIIITLTSDLPAQRGSSDDIFIKILLLSGILLIAIIAFPGIFSFHFHLYQNEAHPSHCFTASKKFVQENKLKLIWALLKLNITLIILGILSYYVLLFLFALYVYFTADQPYVISIFLSYYPKVNFYCILIISEILFIININLITTIYLKQEKSSFYHCHYQKECSFMPYGFLLLLGCGIFNLITLSFHPNLQLKRSLGSVAVTAHRGNSSFAPENTIPAISQALSEKVDYIEIDVQQTKDGVFVAFHDKKLSRIAGINQSIHHLTYDEIKSLDAGGHFSPQFSGTTIPILEDVLRLCKGKVMLNLDLKSYDRYDIQEEALIELLDRYQMLDQCYISSTNLEILKEVKGLAPEVKTGYIITISYGSLPSEYDLIDFYSIHANYVSKSIVQEAHKLGKEVHAWTITTPESATLMNQYGVDNIITDNPTMVITTLNQDPTNTTLIQLLQRMPNFPHEYTIP